MNLYRHLLISLLAGVLLPSQPHAQPRASDSMRPSEETLRVVQLVEGEPIQRNHPSGLPTLLTEVTRTTRFSFAPDPVFIQSFDDPRLFEAPFTFVNYADRADWQLAESEVDALRLYLENGGFLYIDAGINSEFLRENASLGQSHSFADWEVTPVLEEQFARVFPDLRFDPLPRNHPIFDGFYSGLPDPEPLPEAIRDYIVHEKWPQGSYSILALKNESGRILAIATPIISLGWGRDRFGQWTSTISFRVREAAEGLDERVSQAAYSGNRFESVREDGSVDIIYTQPRHMPAWVQEATGRWRVFRYYHGPEISEYAHEFYTRLGVNILVYALAEGP